MRIVLSPRRRRKRQWVPNKRRSQLAVAFVMLLVAALTAYIIAHVAAQT